MRRIPLNTALQQPRTCSVRTGGTFWLTASLAAQVLHDSVSAMRRIAAHSSVPALFRSSVVSEGEATAVRRCLTVWPASVRRQLHACESASQIKS
jgi:hypothetical protein